MGEGLGLSQSSNPLKMRQVHNWLYVAGLIVILSVNLSLQEPYQNSDISSEPESETQDDSPLWPYFYYGGSNSENQEALTKRVLPYIVHKRMPYIVHKRMAYVPVHKRLLEDERMGGDEDVAQILQQYRPRTLRMIPFIH